MVHFADEQLERLIQSSGFAAMEVSGCALLMRLWLRRLGIMYDANGTSVGIDFGQMIGAKYGNEWRQLDLGKHMASTYPSWEILRYAVTNFAQILRCR